MISLDLIVLFCCRAICLTATQPLQWRDLVLEFQVCLQVSQVEVGSVTTVGSFRLLILL